MKVMENDADWQFVTIGDQVTVSLFKHVFKSMS